VCVGVTYHCRLFVGQENLREKKFMQKRIKIILYVIDVAQHINRSGPLNILLLLNKMLS
jgi:hypothetical protein